MLKVAHINKEKIAQERRADALWEEVLKPNFDKLAKARARRRFAKYGLPISEDPKSAT